MFFYVESGECVLFEAWVIVSMKGHWKDPDIAPPPHPHASTGSWRKYNLRILTWCKNRSRCCQSWKFIHKTTLVVLTKKWSPTEPNLRGTKIQGQLTDNWQAWGVPKVRNVVHVFISVCLSMYAIVSIDREDNWTAVAYDDWGKHGKMPSLSKTTDESTYILHRKTELAPKIWALSPMHEQLSNL